MRIRLAILGLGNVPLALMRYLREPPAKRALSEIGAEISVTGVTTGSRGNAVDPGGLSLERLLAVGKRGDIGALNKGPKLPGNNLEFIDEVPADILFVATPAKVESLDEIRRAFSKGMSVITSNKTPVSKHYHDLLADARDHSVQFRFGATVLAGFPPWKQLFESTSFPEISELQIVVNATSNNILTLMHEKGMIFDEGVAEAQRLGIAERDVSDDVDGYDTQKKLAILGNVVMNAQLTPSAIPTRGIRGVQLGDLHDASNRGHWIQLLGRAWREAGDVRAVVEPVETDNPFFVRMRNTSMGLYFVTEYASFGIRLDLGTGEKAIMATAAGLFADVISIIKK